MPRKTIKEWLQELPEPYRTEALENCYNPDLKRDCLNRALTAAFEWRGSEQGYDYWYGLRQKLISEGK